MKLRFKKHSQVGWLLMYIFALPFAFSFLIDLLHIPSSIKYTIDFALVLLLLLMNMNNRHLDFSKIEGILQSIGFFLLITIIGFVLEYKSIVYYVWGLRNNIRFFLFFVACALMMKREDADSCMQLMDNLFYINAIVSLYQVFVLRVHQDHVGGIFGSTRGCNAYTNIYFIIIAAWHMLRYVNKEETLARLLIKCGVALVIAAFAELKIFFLEFALITIIVLVITKFSMRKFWIITGAIAGVNIGVQLIAILFPHFVDWFNVDKIIEYASSEAGYSAARDMNRLTAISISWNRFLVTWQQKMFGLGLGNCDYSSNFAFLTTPFYEKYRHLNYIWFSTSFLFLETGILGLATYVYFFVCVYRGAKKVEQEGKMNIVYCQLARVAALMAPLLIIYNSSLRMECAYMFFFVLALPFIQQPSENEKKINK